MNINFAPLTVIWGILAAIVVVMAVYRYSVSSHEEDETLHIEDPVVNTHQAQVAHKLDVIDKWGKLLTVVAAVYGLALVLAYTYQNWIRQSTLGI